MMKNILLCIGLATLVITVIVLSTYAYALLLFGYTWECKVYTGHQSPEAVKVCRQFNEGGLIKVLTN